MCFCVPETFCTHVDVCTEQCCQHEVRDRLGPGRGERNADEAVGCVLSSGAARSLYLHVARLIKHKEEFQKMEWDFMKLNPCIRFHDLPPPHRLQGNGLAVAHAWMAVDGKRVESGFGMKRRTRSRTVSRPKPVLKMFWTEWYDPHGSPGLQKNYTKIKRQK